MIRGSAPALVTPFANGGLDEATFKDLVEWQIQEGSSALVPMGTTGESPTVSHEEHRRVVELCIQVADKRVPVVAGAGSNSTREALSLAQFAESAGADAVLVVTPYYNKPTQDGLYIHFRTVSEGISIPVFIYNIPGRSIIDMSVETMTRLYHDCDNIIGVKDATADVSRASAQRIAMGEDFVQLSGEDATALGFNAHGGVGCISVTANVAPRACADMQAACARGDFETALSMHNRLMPLHEALFAETSPAPVKYALSLLERCSPRVRKPLAPLHEETKQRVHAAMVHAGLLNA